MAEGIKVERTGKVVHVRVHRAHAIPLALDEARELLEKLTAALPKKNPNVYSMKEMRALYGDLDRSTIYDHEELGLIPRRKTTKGRRALWDKGEVDRHRISIKSDDVSLESFKVVFGEAVHQLNALLRGRRSDWQQAVNYALRTFAPLADRKQRDIAGKKLGKEWGELYETKIQSVKKLIARLPSETSKQLMQGRILAGRRPIFEVILMFHHFMMERGLIRGADCIRSMGLMISFLVENRVVYVDETVENWSGSLLEDRRNDNGFSSTDEKNASPDGEVSREEKA